MKRIVHIDNELLEEAKKCTGVQETTELVHMGLQVLIQKAAANRLVRLGGAAPNLQIPPRRRSEKTK